MSHTMPIERAAATLSELVASLGPTDEIVLTEDGLPVAKIVPQRASSEPRRPGSCRGMLTIHSDDDDYLRDFKGYMP